VTGTALLWIRHLELWAGPAPEGRTEPEPWRRTRDYPLDRLA
jgi:hypothetical protein